jgi:putative phage-type endonuclease
LLQSSTICMAIRVRIKQGTPEWLRWREDGLGSSDIPAVLGISPWKTPQDLLMTKAHRIAGPPPNAAMLRGSQMEPLIRETYQRESYIHWPAATFQHEDYPFMLASLDGFNEELNVTAEFKAPNKYDHYSAVNGEVPEKYVPQCQHILLVTGAYQLHYVSRFNNENAAVLVKPDPDYHEMLIEKETEFWNKVLKLRNSNA